MESTLDTQVAAALGIDLLELCPGDVDRDDHPICEACGEIFNWSAYDEDSDVHFPHTPRRASFSQSWAGAGQVIEAMRERGYGLSLFYKGPNGWVANFNLYGDDGCDITAPLAMSAICIAALNALET